MTNSFFTIPHEVEGELAFFHEQASVRIRARWPFDLSTDEWIYLSVLLPTDGFEEALTAVLDSNAKATVSAIGGDTLALTPLSNGIEFDMTDATIRPPKRLMLLIARNDAINLRQSIIAERGQRDDPKLQLG